MNLSAQHIATLFPFYLALDHDLNITGMGPSIQKLAGDLVGQPFEGHFKFKRPSFGIKCEYQSIAGLSNQVFVIEMSRSRDTPPLFLRGQVTKTDAEQSALLFLVSPWLAKVEDLEVHGLNITDFAVHDPVTDLLQIIKSQEVAAQDVTNLAKELEIQKNELEARNKLVEDMAKFPLENPSPVIRISSKGELLFANDTAKLILKSLPEQEQETVKSVLSRLATMSFNSGQVIKEIRAVGQDHYSLIVRPIKANGYVNIYGHNVTSRIQAEKEARQSEEKYRNIIEGMNLGFMEVDLDDNIVEVYDYFCQMTGYAREELVGQKSQGILFPKEFKSLLSLQNVKRIVKKSGSYELKLKQKDGKDIWVLVHGTPSYDEAGNVTGSINVYLDISDRHEMELNLKKERANAEASLVAKENFLANMSHEIRTPMNAILGMSNLLSKGQLTNDQQQHLNAIRTSGEALLVIINDILDLSKIESGKLEFEHVAFRPMDVIDHVVKSSTYRLSEKDLFVSTRKTSIHKDVVLFGDPVRLNQVLTNLVSNAVKFTERGEINIEAHLTGADALQISVEDTGIGIKSENLGKIFKSFTQEDASTTRLFGGTGLGLAICRQLVELQGGSIKVESVEGKGSRFTFEIPFEQGTTRDIKEETITRDETDLNGTRVLLVEDHQMNQLLAESLLAMWGCQTTVADNGQLATELVRQQAFDIILMDMQMPIMGGLEATEIIRNVLHSTTPIVALTANALKGEQEKCLAAGMNDYISKPFEETVLKHTIAKWATSNAPGVVPVHSPIADQANATVSSALKLDKLQQLSRGDATFEKRMLNLFIGETEKSLANCQNITEADQVAAVKKAAHKMKPSIDLLVNGDLTKQVRVLESWDEHLPLTKLSQATNLFVQEMDQILQAVREQLAQMD